MSGSVVASGFLPSRENVWFFPHIQMFSYCTSHSSSSHKQNRSIKGAKVSVGWDFSKYPAVTPLCQPGLSKPSYYCTEMEMLQALGGSSLCCGASSVCHMLTHTIITPRDQRGTHFKGLAQINQAHLKSSELKLLLNVKSLNPKESSVKSPFYKEDCLGKPTSILTHEILKKNTGNLSLLQKVFTLNTVNSALKPDFDSNCCSKGSFLDNN